MLARSVSACELCAISSASSARGESTSGFLFTFSEQFVPYNTEQFEGKEFERRDGTSPDWLDKSITHLVPTYNFSERVGVSLNVPIIYEEFKRFYLNYSPSGALLPPATERGREFGLGDMSLIGRVTVLSLSEMEWGFGINVMAGVKFPTGDTARLQDEAEEARLHEHRAVSGVHQSDLTLGSGSFDGIFGFTINARWQRFYFSTLTQYYLRTEGESTYTYADEVMINGGPGYYVLLNKRYTLNLQAYAGYESRGRDSIDGKLSNDTGMTGWYMGPQIGFTWGLHFSATAAVDVPLTIYNNGFMNVPNYRIHGGLTWRF